MMPTTSFRSKCTDQMPTKLAYSVVFVLGLVAYAGSLHGPFVLDDLPAIVHNRDVHSYDATTGAGAWTNLFKNDYWGTPIGSPKSHKSYRPLTVATFKATYYFFGLYPTVFHGLNCLLHATVSAAVLFLASAIYALLSTPPRSSTSSSSTSTFSLVVALVFALHPLHGDAVASIVGRAELLYSLLLLCSLYTYSVSISMAPPARFSLSTFPSSDRTHDDSSPRSSSLALAATHTTSSALVYASEWDPLGDRSPVAGPRFVDSLLFASYSWTLAWLATLAKEQGVTAFGLMAAMELAAMTFPALTNTLSPQLQHKQQQCRRIPGLSRMALLRLSVTVSHVALAWWFRAWLNVTPPSFKPIDAPVAHAPDTWTWLLSAAWSWGKAWQLLFAPFTALPPAPVVADSNPFFLSSLTRMFQIFSSDYSGTPLLTSADPTVEPRVYVAVLGAALFLGALLYQIGFTLVYFFPALICHVQCALAGGDGSTSLSSSSSSPAAAAAPGPRLWLALFAASLLYTMPFLPASHLILDVGFFFAERVLYLPSLGMILTVAVVVHAATDKTISLLQKGTNVDSVSSAPQEPAKPSQTVSTSASIATSTSISASSSHVSASRSGKSKASNPPSTTTTTTTDSAPAVTTSSSVLSASSTHAHGSSSAEASKASPPSSTGAAVTVVVVVAVAALALVALLVGSVSRSAAWADPSSMWVQDAQTSPSSAKLATTQCADLAAAGDLSAAQKPCERAVELDPKFVLGRSNLCALYVKQGRLEDAERECVAALGADATWSAAHASLCVIHEARGELESAAARCRASLAANEQQPAVHALACIVLRKLDDLSGAERHCLRAVELAGSVPNPDHVVALARVKEALATRMLGPVHGEYAPVTPETFSSARLREANALTSAAMALVDGVLRTDKQHPGAHNAKCRLIVRQPIPDWAQAVRHCTFAVERAPSTNAYQVDLADVLVRTDRIDEGLQLRPLDADLLVKIADALVRRRRHSEALATLEFGYLGLPAGQLPRQGRLARKYGHLLQHMGRVEEGEIVLREAVSPAKVDREFF